MIYIRYKLWSFIVVYLYFVMRIEISFCGYEILMLCNGIFCDNIVINVFYDKYYSGFFIMFIYDLIFLYLL